MNELRRSTECMSDLVLDRLLSNELGAAAAGLARAHLAACSGCAARHAELVADRAQFARGAPGLAELLSASSHPLGAGGAVGSSGASRASPPPSIPSAASSSSGERAHVGKARRAPRVWAGFSLAAAAAVALGVGLRELDRGDEEAARARDRGDAPSAPLAGPAMGGVRTKGAAVALGFVVRRAGVIRDGHSGDVLHPGDVLRFTLGSSHPGYAAVWGIDARGGVVALAEGRALAPVAAAQRQVLPGAFELDESVGGEQLVAVLCERSLSIAEISAALQAAPAATRLPSGCVSDSVPIRKERP